MREQKINDMKKKLKLNEKDLAEYINLTSMSLYNFRKNKASKLLNHYVELCHYLIMTKGDLNV